MTAKVFERLASTETREGELTPTPTKDEGMGLLAVRRLLLLRFWVLDKPRFSAEGMGS